MVAPVPGGNTPKMFTYGTHRAMPPQETLARLAPYLAEYGITRVANITGLDELGIPVVMAIRPNARSLSVSQGKGADLVAAKVSALMESIEQHHAEHDRLHLRWASHDELARREPVIDPDRLARLGRRYDGRAKILWSAAKQLSDGATYWVPYELVHLNFTLPLPPGSGYFLGGSNGLASGNTYAEALVHAIDELIERDALTLLYRRSQAEQQRRRLDPASVTDELCASLLARYERGGVAVGIWDATSDLDVPTYLCDVIDRETNVFRPLGSARGTGCHIDPAVALARALTEAAQSRLTRIAGSRDDLQSAHVDVHRSPDKIAADRARVLAASATGARLARFDPPILPFASFEQELAHLLERLRAAGVESVLAVDLSPPDRPFHVVRVIAPGLEGPSDNPGYRPGRRALALGGSPS
jgi:YcaO-like protein with predicted kinase domain